MADVEESSCSADQAKEDEPSASIENTLAVSLIEGGNNVKEMSSLVPAVRKKRKMFITICACGFVGRYRSAMQRHHKRSNNPKCWSGPVQFPAPRVYANREQWHCPICRIEFVPKLMSTVQHHVTEVHNITLEMVTAQFASEREFEEWRSDTLRWFGHDFLPLTGRQVYINCTRRKYYCAFSGKPHLKSESERRQRNKDGVTKKSGFKCVASIDTLYIPDSGIVEVKACLTHIGHELLGKHVNIPVSLEHLISGLIAKGLRAADIIKIVSRPRDGVPIDPKNPRFFVTQSNVRIIAQRFNLELAKGKSCLEDDVIKELSLDVLELEADRTKQLLQPSNFFVREEVVEEMQLDNEVSICDEMVELNSDHGQSDHAQSDHGQSDHAQSDHVYSDPATEVVAPNNNDIVIHFIEEVPNDQVILVEHHDQPKKKVPSKFKPVNKALLQKKIRGRPSGFKQSLPKDCVPVPIDEGEVVMEYDTENDNAASSVLSSGVVEDSQQVVLNQQNICADCCLFCQRCRACVCSSDCCCQSKRMMCQHMKMAVAMSKQFEKDDVDPSDNEQESEEVPHISRVTTMRLLELMKSQMERCAAALALNRGRTAAASLLEMNRLLHLHRFKPDAILVSRKIQQELKKSTRAQKTKKPMKRLKTATGPVIIRCIPVVKLSTPVPDSQVPIPNLPLMAPDASEPVSNPPEQVSLPLPVSVPPELASYSPPPSSPQPESSSSLPEPISPVPVPELALPVPNLQLTEPSPKLSVPVHDSSVRSSLDSKQKRPSILRKSARQSAIRGEDVLRKCKVFVNASRQEELVPHYVEQVNALKKSNQLEGVPEIRLYNITEEHLQVIGWLCNKPASSVLEMLHSQRSIDTSMVCQVLSDINDAIADVKDIKAIRPCFEEDAWSLVMKVFDDKVKDYRRRYKKSVKENSS